MTDAATNAEIFAETWQAEMREDAELTPYALASRALAEVALRAGVTVRQPVNQYHVDYSPRIQLSLQICDYWHGNPGGALCCVRPDCDYAAAVREVVGCAKEWQAAARVPEPSSPYASYNNYTLSERLWRLNMFFADDGSVQQYERICHQAAAECRHQSQLLAAFGADAGLVVGFAATADAMTAAAVKHRTHWQTELDAAIAEKAALPRTVAATAKPLAVAVRYSAALLRPELWTDKIVGNFIWVASLDVLAVADRQKLAKALPPVAQQDAGAAKRAETWFHGRVQGYALATPTFLGVYNEAVLTQQKTMQTEVELAVYALASGVDMYAAYVLRWLYRATRATRVAVAEKEKTRPLVLLRGDMRVAVLAGTEATGYVLPDAETALRCLGVSGG